MGGEEHCTLTVARLEHPRRGVSPLTALSVSTQRSSTPGSRVSALLGTTTSRSRSPRTLLGRPRTTLAWAGHEFGSFGVGMVRMLYMVGEDVFRNSQLDHRKSWAQGRFRRMPSPPTQQTMLVHNVWRVRRTRMMRTEGWAGKN